MRIASPAVSSAARIRGVLPAYDALPRLRPRRAVPRGTGLTRSRGRIRLHTVQAPGAYGALVQQGRLAPDPAWARSPGQEQAYPWMSRQMTERGQPGTSMVWLWASISRADLLDCAHLAAGDVLITVDVAADRALLSDFVAWHHPLNGWLLVPQQVDESDEAWEQRFDEVHADWDARTAGVVTTPLADMDLATWPQDLRAELEASWEPVVDPGSWDRATEIQATLREIRAEDVVRAVRITASLNERIRRRPG